jgi:hypothetical protein
MGALYLVFEPTELSAVRRDTTRRLQELLVMTGQDTQLNLFQHVHIAKVCNDLDEPVPAGVEVLLAEGNDEQSAGEQWQALLTEPVLIASGAHLVDCTGSSNRGRHGGGNSTGPTRTLTSLW